MLRTLHDSQQLRDLAQTSKRFVVIGSSFIGLEGAMSLRKLGAEVAVVGTDAVPFAKILGERIGRVIQGWHEKEGITFHLGRKAERFEGDSSVQAVVLDNGDQLPAEVVLLGLGVTPQTDFLKNMPLEEDGGVKTDAYLKVADGLYAAGDIAHYPTANGLQRIEHWKVAGQQGHVAGMNMARSQSADQEEINPVGAEMKAELYQLVPFFWTNQQGKRINYVGHTDSFDDIVYDGNPETDESFLALYVDKGTIKAAAGLKRDTDIIAIRELMQMNKMPSVAQVQPGMNWMDALKKS